jgi:uncharacterized membrane protein YraQ (UPF0718 family)
MKKKKCSCSIKCENLPNKVCEDESEQIEKKQNWFLRHKKTTIFLSVVVGILLANIFIGFVWGWKIVEDIWQFFSDQILGMKWLNTLIGLLIGGLFGQEFLAGSWGASIQFFLYDSIKITFLLCFLIFVISYIQSFFPPEKTKKILSKFTGIKANIFGALLGTVTPFCSCSSIPIFIGFTRAGLSTGVIFSFLISSPLVDLGAFVLLISVFGFPIAIAYVVVGLILAVIGGTLIEKSGAGKYVEDFVTAGSNIDIEQKDLSKKDRLTYAKEQVSNTFKKVWLFILIGVLIGSVIHNWIPTEWISAVLGQDKWYSVLVASVVGVPMYADIFGTIPIAEALFAKGVGVGTILAFMMSVTALSLPSMIMLRRAIKPRLLWTFVGIVTAGIIIIGYVFNAFNFLFV